MRAGGVQRDRSLWNWVIWTGGHQAGAAGEEGEHWDNKGWAVRAEGGRWGGGRVRQGSGMNRGGPARATRPPPQKKPNLCPLPATGCDVACRVLQTRRAANTGCASLSPAGERALQKGGTRVGAHAAEQLGHASEAAVSSRGTSVIDLALAKVLNNPLVRRWGGHHPAERDLHQRARSPWPCVGCLHAI